MTSRLTIDLAALAANFQTLRAEVKGVEVAPVVKAGGYGLGTEQAAGRLALEGATSFFVARACEGSALRKSLGAGPTLYVLDGITNGTAAELHDNGLTPVLSTAESVRDWIGDFALHVDTGMNRLGVSVSDALDLAAAGAKPSLVMSHLSRGDRPDLPNSADQLARFRPVRDAFPHSRASIAASSGIYLGPDFHLDMVRPGISLFGGGPREAPDARFAAVATLEAEVLQIRDLKAGEAAGYGTMFTADRDMRMAMVGAGYADGVLRSAHGKAQGIAAGIPCLFTIVTMDLIGLDITDAPLVQVGDWVELLGPNALLDDLAKAAGSVAHECLVNLGRRSTRTYTSRP